MENLINLEYIKIIQHEGKNSLNYEGKKFNNYVEIQNAFFKLWELNEKGNFSGYTKVKIELKLKNEPVKNKRIDITNDEDGEDFNPALIDIFSYLTLN